jgi:hypothetical protein
VTSDGVSALGVPSCGEKGSWCGCSAGVKAGPCRTRAPWTRCACASVGKAKAFERWRARARRPRACSREASGAVGRATGRGTSGRGKVKPCACVQGKAGRAGQCTCFPTCTLDESSGVGAMFVTNGGERWGLGAGWSEERRCRFMRARNESMAFVRVCRFKAAAQWCAFTVVRPV